MTENKFALLSGGRDSVVAAHKMFQDAENDRKNPVAVYLDTTIGITENREYIEDLCDRYNWQLWTLRTQENYEELVRKYGFPGPAKHQMAYAALKERQLRKLGSIAEDPVFYTGIRRHESRRRMGNAEYEQEQHGALWKSEIIDWTIQDVKEYIDEHDIPESPLWDKGHFKDCGCGAYGTPEELLELEANHPEIYEEIRELENSLDRQDEYGVWGNNGLSRAQVRAERTPDDAITLCSFCGEK